MKTNVASRKGIPRGTKMANPLAGRRVYVQLRIWSIETRRMMHVRNRNVIFDGFSPDEVHRIIVAAGQAAQERAKEKEAHGAT